MINSYSISNFKAFGETQTIPIKPITLIYGANSSGKSSIIHALMLSQHAQKKNELDVHHTVLGGNYLDLGGFNQYCHGHNSDRSKYVIFRFDCDCKALKGVDSAAIETYFGFSSDSQGNDTKVQIRRVDIRLNGLDAISLYRNSKENFSFRPIDSEGNKLFNKLLLDRANEMMQSNTGPTQEMITNFLSTKEDVKLKGLFPSSPGDITSLLDYIGSSITPKNEKATRGKKEKATKEDSKVIVDIFNKVIPEISLFSIFNSITDSIENFLSSIIYLGPFRVFPLRHAQSTEYIDPNWQVGGGRAWEMLRTNGDLRLRVNNWLADNKRTIKPYSVTIGSLVDKNQLLAEMREHFALEKATRNKIDKVIHRVEKNNIGAELDEVLLIDEVNRLVVSPRDVGVGISQVIPLLTYAYGFTNKTIVIEQPELHLHPALQAELGDVFIDSAKCENKNRFLIETHSEHLLLRIMKRMRQTADGVLPVGTKPIKPTDICVLFVQPMDSSSIVIEMPLNDRGELMRPWPGGFFEEGFEELF